MKIFKRYVHTFDVVNSQGMVIYVCQFHFRTRKLCRAYSRIILDHYNNCHCYYYKASPSVLQKMRPFSELFDSTNLIKHVPDYNKN